MTRSMIAAALTTLTLGTRASAETGIREGDTVTLKLPTVFLSQGKSGLLEAKPTYIVDLVEERGQISPWGAPQWRAAGFPDLGRFEVSKVRSGKRYTEAELKNETRVVKLRFMPSVRDVGAAFTRPSSKSPSSCSSTTALLCRWTSHGEAWTAPSFQRERAQGTSCSVLAAAGSNPV
jgi:hypothetical protein